MATRKNGCHDTVTVGILQAWNGKGMQTRERRGSPFAVQKVEVIPQWVQRRPQSLTSYRSYSQRPCVCHKWESATRKCGITDLGPASRTIVPTSFEPLIYTRLVKYVFTGEYAQVVFWGVVIQTYQALCAGKSD